MTLKTLGESFCATVGRQGGRPALEVSGQNISYEQLYEKAASFAAILEKSCTAGGPALTAIFAHRSVTAFAGVVGALLRGHGYVPLNKTFPSERTRAMLQRSGCNSMIVDEASSRQLDQVLDGLDRALVILLPETGAVEELASRHPRHKFLGQTDLAGHDGFVPIAAPADALAYVLFTSGSTGTPKGVMVAQRNVRHYVDFICERFDISSKDRLSQTFDMTFDLSASDMFVAWERGACLCCLSEKTLLNPARFIADSKVTFWFSVPSTGVFMKRLGSLKAGAFPDLRVSLFCGEALPAEIARAWSLAAPNSIVENVYGPTELTIACTYYRWDESKSPGESEHGVVPIGEPFSGMTAVVVDEFLNEVPRGEEGELLMTGPQLSLGYLDDPARTAAAFIRLPGRGETFYRTGDRVRRPLDGAPMTYLGRMDNQIKILGHRVELGEVEAVVREASGVDGVVALGWPRTPGGAGGIEVFLETESPLKPDLQQQVERRLPVYMAPRKYRPLPRLPLNSNGKYDRPALVRLLEPSS
jgi:amino acid adenylation domain-containing protein